MPLIDYSAERAASLRLAIEFHQGQWETNDPAGNQTSVLGTANVFYGYLTGAVRIGLTLGSRVDQTTGRITGDPGGNTMKDTEKVQLTVTAEDAKGQVTAGPSDLTFTSSDETVVTISTDADGTMWAVAGNPGSAVITADWPDSPSGDLTGTLAVDVTTGDATSLVISAGGPVAQ